MSFFDLIQIGMAGVLAIPALLVQVVSAPLVALLSIPSLKLLCFRKKKSKSLPSSSITNDNSTTTTTSSSAHGAHAIITGGSSGIGLSIAEECIHQKGISRITIIARNKSKLETAVKQLQQKVKEATGTTTTKTTMIDYKSVDVSNATAMNEIANELCNGNQGKIYLFCCAGQPYPSYLEDISSETFLQLVQVNQLGSIYTCQAFLPHLKKPDKAGGTIVLTSSMGGQVSVFGFGAYGPTKFALRGYAETLHSELVAVPNVHVQMAFPPDTDTPGFAYEETIKPIETRLISENAGLAKPHDIATTMITSAMSNNPKFFVYFNFEGWMLAALTSGMSPVSSLMDAITQVTLMGLFRFISLFYLNDWWRIIRNEDAKKKKTMDQQNKKSSKDATKSSKDDTTTTQRSDDDKLD